MAHQQQKDYCILVKKIFPEYFKNVSVCDIGSLDINGSNHYLFEEYVYMGVDVGRGRNVNFVSRGHEFKPIGEKYDTVISTECFEHDMYWNRTMINICENLVRDGGMFIFTCATTGRAEHGTVATTIGDSPFTSNTEGWSDYYMNLTEEDVRQAIPLDKYFKVWHFYVNEISHDLYFWGIKK